MGRLLEGPGEARHYQGPPGIDAWVKRNCLSQKKKFGLCGHWRTLEGPGEARHCQEPSGTTRDQHFDQKKPFEQKKISAFVALRLLEGPGEARHYQGPPGIDAWVKRNRLSPKKKFGLCGLCGHWGPLEGPGEARHCQ